MDQRTSRRTLLAAATATTLAGQSQPQTLTYKSAAGLAIRADVYSPAAGGKPRPVVLWIHGGALIMGNREGMSAPVKKWAEAAGYILVSIDYRLAPETQLPAIITDVEDAYAWIRREGKRLFNGDAARIAVAGGSVGGYLTLTLGSRAKPRPRVLLSLWGYGDLVGDWYSKPSPHPRHHQSKLTAEEARAQVSGPPISDARDRKGNGGAFYQYCRQQGTWPRAVSGWDPVREASRFYPYMPLKNVRPDFPPTVLIHGTADTDVPHEQSEQMAREFARAGVRHEFFSIPGAEHGLSGGDPRKIDDAYTRAFAFLDRELAR